MNTGGAQLLGPDARALRRALAGAADEHVMRVLRYVDALPDRGAVDSLLAPVRARLRHLRPPRPLRLPRLLFTPLDPVLVSAQDWRPGAARLPRSAMLPLCALVRAACPAASDEADHILADLALPERERIEAAGALMWEPAAAALRAASLPDSWQEAALPAAHFAPLASGVATCLAAAAPFAALADPAVTATDREARLLALLRVAQSGGPVGWGMLLTIALQLFPTAEAPLQAATARMEPAQRGAAADALNAGWSWIEDGVEDMATAAVADAAPLLRRRLHLLAELAKDPTQRSRAAALQIRLRDTCTARLAAGLQDQVIGPLGAPPAGAPKMPREAAPGQAPEATDPANLAEPLEEELRELMQLDIESRHLECGAAHDVLLHRAADSVRHTAALTAMERARLLDILLGPAAALAALHPPA